MAAHRPILQEKGQWRAGRFSHGTRAELQIIRYDPPGGAAGMAGANLRRALTLR